MSCVMRWSPDPGARARRARGAVPWGWSGGAWHGLDERIHSRILANDRIRASRRASFALCGTGVLGRSGSCWHKPAVSGLEADARRLASAAPALHYPTPGAARRGRDERARLKDWHAFWPHASTKHVVEPRPAVIGTAGPVLPLSRACARGRRRSYVGGGGALVRVDSTTLVIVRARWRPARTGARGRGRSRRSSAAVRPSAPRPCPSRAPRRPGEASRRP
jgi:hypothetical protein